MSNYSVSYLGHFVKGSLQIEVSMLLNLRRKSIPESSKLQLKRSIQGPVKESKKIALICT